MKITAASSDDLGPIRDLLHSSEMPYTGVTPYSVANYLVAKNDMGHVVGTIEIDPYDDDAMLRSMAVDDDFHTTGVHELIIAAAESHAISLGMKRIYILAHDNDKFFIDRGYTAMARQEVEGPISETPEFRAKHAESTVCMTRTLDA